MTQENVVILHENHALRGITRKYMFDNKDNLGYQSEKIRSLREMMGVNRTEFSRLNGIPLRTVEDWEAGRRKMPDYVLRLLTYKIEIQQNKTYASKNVNIIRDECGKSIVIINDVRFKSRRNINWDKVEEYLKEYIGRYYEIAETSEKIYIGTDFPDELKRYNIFSARMLVRCDADGKMYLYDFVRKKKKRAARMSKNSCTGKPM